MYIMDANFLVQICANWTDKKWILGMSSSGTLAAFEQDGKETIIITVILQYVMKDTWSNIQIVEKKERK